VERQPVFSDQVEQFTAVVHALLQDEETRVAFAKEPLATLRRHGIAFKDPAVAKRVEGELAAFAGELDEYTICPPWFFARVSARVGTWTSTASYARTGSIARATNVTWAVKPRDIEEVISVNQPRVDAFLTQVGTQGRIAILEAEIAKQAERIAELEARLGQR
jgi:hypothetical protein